MVVVVAGGGNTGEVYHQEETVIGTWIDGKPIYRQIITGTAPTDGTSVVVLDDVDWLVNSYASASIKYSYKEYPTYFNMPISYTEKTMGQVQFDKTYSKVRLYFGTANSEYGGNPYYAILEYTKTTD